MLDGSDQTSERAQRRAAREVIGRYHEEQLGLLLERVREGFARMDAGEIDAFELDDLIPASPMRNRSGSWLIRRLTDLFQSQRRARQDLLPETPDRSP